MFSEKGGKRLTEKNTHDHVHSGHMEQESKRESTSPSERGNYVTSLLSRSNRESTEPQLNIFSRKPYANVKRSQQGSFAISLHGRITVCLSPGGGRNQQGWNLTSYQIAFEFYLKCQIWVPIPLTTCCHLSVSFSHLRCVVIQRGCEAISG